MENFDPVGVHTGDSIVVAPAVTLSDKEYQMLRTAALSIIDELKIEGGCNCQFALHPESMGYAVIEVNPRVSRSSALASKATGYPIAKVAAKIAIGYTLPEILNAVTGKTYACFEPALDYVVVKFPKWPFDKFVYAKRTLGTQMKATGEVMAIGTTFEQAIMKAVRGVEIGMSSLSHKKYRALSDEEIAERLHNVDDERIFIVYEALRRGTGIDEIHSITMIDEWFLSKLRNLVRLEKRLASEPLTKELYLTAKKLGFPDKIIEELSGQTLSRRMHRSAVYKMVDTCAAEFTAKTPYFYSTYDEENEAAEFIEEQNPARQENGHRLRLRPHPHRPGHRVRLLLGPLRLGAARSWGMRRSSPTTTRRPSRPTSTPPTGCTSTRSDPGGRGNLIETEKPYGVVVQFGGQTAIKLTKYLRRARASTSSAPRPTHRRGGGPGAV